jgi:lipopolysaccharide transport system ATP-binding protein
MSHLMIEAENISKRYRLGIPGSKTIQEELKNWWTGKTIPAGISRLSSSFGKQIWALRDVSFGLEQGEVLGILGKNGAGKSTLLKIISRISLPSAGIIRGNGRVASLLEIGTGFHQELSGKENIYLYGHIMGMKRKEIDSKFDEIVSFSGIDELLGTAVKRYSSGSYVRLAFAVAAHLDPEILIIDEVLAVGDQEFQRKCMSKIREISTKQGKTILFVSHNMQTLKSICHRTMLLDKGELIEIGDPQRVITTYLKRENANPPEIDYCASGSMPGNNWIAVQRIWVQPEDSVSYEGLNTATPLLIQFESKILSPEIKGLVAVIAMFDVYGNCLFELSSRQYTVRNGLIHGQCRIPADFLAGGFYTISISFHHLSLGQELNIESCLEFNLDEVKEDYDSFGRWKGMVVPNFPVTIQNI